jgi:Mlc titration factor MtfA (ptsG expression regulator)
MSVVTMAVAVIHNTICEILGNSGKLSQLFCCSGVDINRRGHIEGLDVRLVREVLHTLRQNEFSIRGVPALGKRTRHQGIKAEPTKACPAQPGREQVRLSL